MKLHEAEKHIATFATHHAMQCGPDAQPELAFEGNVLNIRCSACLAGLKLTFRNYCEHELAQMHQTFKAMTTKVQWPGSQTQGRG